MIGWWINIYDVFELIYVLSVFLDPGFDNLWSVVGWCCDCVCISALIVDNRTIFLLDWPSREANATYTLVIAIWRSCIYARTNNYSERVMVLVLKASDKWTNAIWSLKIQLKQTNKHTSCKD